MSPNTTRHEECIVISVKSLFIHDRGSMLFILLHLKSFKDLSNYSWSILDVVNCNHPRPVLDVNYYLF